jgi:hypothetical protein
MRYVTSGAVDVGESADEFAPKQALRYFAAMLAGALLFVGGYFSALLAFAAMGRLPPPPIANNVCIDEKLSFLRDHPPASPNLLVIGSSVAWRQFDSATIAAEVPALLPLNGAFCGLRVNQAVFAADWLLDRLDSVRSVVLVASPYDFHNCRLSPAAVFDRKAADSFVFGGAWRWGFYLRFFDPVSLVRNVRRIAEMRISANPFESLLLTKFGDGPLDTDASQDNPEYGAISNLDPQCFAALHSFGQRMKAQGRSFSVVTIPLHPEWKQRFDRDGLVRASLARAIRANLAETSATYWDADAAAAMEGTAFTDAIHLRWSAASTFSRKMAEALSHSWVSQ